MGGLEGTGHGGRIVHGTSWVFSSDVSPLVYAVLLSRVLHTERLVVYGEMSIGTKDEPYTNHAEVVLHGNRSSPTLVAAEGQHLGNKNFVVYGNVTMYGTAPAVPWTRLAQTAHTGDLSVTLADVPDGWRVGDSIVIGSTEYPDPAQSVDEINDVHQSEIRIITTIHDHCVEFAEPLSYRHFAGGVSGAADASTQLSGAVGVLSRSIVVRGAMDNTSAATSMYGGHVVVGEVAVADPQEFTELVEQGVDLRNIRRAGAFVGRGVEFRDMGKSATEHPAMLFRFGALDAAAQTGPGLMLADSVWNRCWNSAVQSVGSRELRLVDNVVYRSFGNGIAIDPTSTGTNLTRNLLVGNHRRVDRLYEECRVDSSCYVDPFAAVQVWNDQYVAVHGNFVTGAEDGGFMVQAIDPCGAWEGSVPMSSASAFAHNEVVGAVVGLYALPSRASCVTVAHFQAWKASHMGITTIDQPANMQFRNVTVADSHQGLTLNFVRTGIDSAVGIYNSRIYGSTAASTCNASVDCVAEGGTGERGCFSEFGNNWRRVGIVLPQYTNRRKTCLGNTLADPTACRSPMLTARPCSLPWENRFGNLGVLDARLLVEDSEFGFFASDDCGRQSRALATNPSQPDLTPMVQLRRMSWQSSVDAGARIQMRDASYLTHDAAACGVNCDALSGMVIADLDGTSFGYILDAATQEAAPQGENMSTSSRLGVVSASANDVAAVAQRARTLPGRQRQRARIGTASPHAAVVLRTYVAPVYENNTAFAACVHDTNTQALVCPHVALAPLVFDAPRHLDALMGPASVHATTSGAPLAPSAIGPQMESCSSVETYNNFGFRVSAGRALDLSFVGGMVDESRIVRTSGNRAVCA